MRTQRLWLITVAVLCASVLLLSGCDSKSTKDTAGGSNQMNVTANPGSITTSGSSVVEATVLNGTTPVANVSVTFTVSPSNAGYFSPTTATTDVSGVAATVFTPLNAATATITASASSVSLTDNASLAIADAGGQTGSGNVTISLSPSLILAGNSDSSIVTVAVRDAAGSTAPDSTLIRLVAGEKFVDKDGNGYWSPGVDSLVFDANNNDTWDALGQITSTAKTGNGNGTASVMFFPGNVTGTAYIRATVNDGGISGFAEASVQVRPNAEVYSIYLHADTNQLQVRSTGGVETSELQATLYDVYGNTIPEGVIVNFAVLSGPGGGEWIGTTVGDSVYQAVTDIRGVASAPVHSGTKSGTIRLRAWSDTVLSSATQILVASGPAKHIVVGAQYCNVQDWDKVGEFVGITAVVSDTFLNPVPDSTVVYFSCDEGTMQATQARTKDHLGVAYSQWISGTNVATADGRVLISAETAGGTVTDSGMFFNTHICDTLVVTGMPAQIYADGTSKYSISVVGLDFNGNPVVNGTEFKADARLMNAAGTILGDGCYSSWATVKVTAPLLTIDNSTTNGVGIDDGIGDHDQVIYWSGSAVTRLNVTLLTGTAYSGNCEVDGSTSAANGENLSFNVLVKDRWGNPLGDHTITLSASTGTVVSATHDTDPYGVASGFIWQAPTDTTMDGDFNLNFADSDPRGGLTLSKKVTVK